MRNKIEDLRNHLFETIEMLKDGDIDIDKAKTIADVAQVIVNTAKVEVSFIRATETTEHTKFFKDDRTRNIEANTKFIDRQH